MPGPSLVSLFSFPMSLPSSDRQWLQRPMFWSLNIPEYAKIHPRIIFLCLFPSWHVNLSFNVIFSEKSLWVTNPNVGLPAIQETQVQSLGWEDTLEKATHFRLLAWRIPWTDEPGGLWSVGLQRAGHDWGANTLTFHFQPWRRCHHPAVAHGLTLLNFLLSCHLCVCGCVFIVSHTQLITDTRSGIKQVFRRNEWSILLTFSRLWWVTLGNDSNSPSWLPISRNEIIIFVIVPKGYLSNKWDKTYSIFNLLTHRSQSLATTSLLYIRCAYVQTHVCIKRERMTESERQRGQERERETETYSQENKQWYHIWSCYLWHL